MYVYSSENAKVTGNKVSGNDDDGIHIYSSDNAMVTGNTVTENSVGVSIKGNFIINNRPTVNQNNIFGNGTGLANSSNTSINATNNWWGPGGTGANAGKPGEGGNNDVSGNVTFDPWSTIKF